MSLQSINCILATANLYVPQKTSSGRGCSMSSLLRHPLPNRNTICWICWPSRRLAGLSGDLIMIRGQCWCQPWAVSVWDDFVRFLISCNYVFIYEWLFSPDSDITNLEMLHSPHYIITLFIFFISCSHLSLSPCAPSILHIALSRFHSGSIRLFHCDFPRALRYSFMY